MSAWVPLAVLGVLAYAAAQRPAGAATPLQPGGTSSTHGRALVETRQTGGTDAHAWTRTRVAAAQRVLAAQGYDAATARRLAVALVAQWARETGWGRAEWNHSVGNIKATGWQGDYHRLSDGQYYRSYPTLDEGVADAIRLHQSSRYRAAWDHLVSTGDPVGWYDRIMRAGYHPWSQEALTDMQSIAARVDRERVAGWSVEPWDVVGWCDCVAQQLLGGA